MIETPPPPPPPNQLLNMSLYNTFFPHTSTLTCIVPSLSMKPWPRLSLANGSYKCRDCFKDSAAQQNFLQHGE